MYTTFINVTCSQNEVFATYMLITLHNIKKPPQILNIDESLCI